MKNRNGSALSTKWNGFSASLSTSTFLFLAALFSPLLGSEQVFAFQQNINTQLAPDVAANPKVSVRPSIEKALPYIERRGEWWINKKKCMSCHRTSFMAWSHLEAERAGVVVDKKKVEQWVEWNHENLFEPFPKKDQKYPGEKTIERNLFGASQMLFVTSVANKKEYQESEKRILSNLKKKQKGNGSWDPKGQLPGQKRSLLETTHVVTSWNMLGLLQLKESQPSLTNEIDPIVEKAKQYCNDFEGAESTEWFAVSLLVDLKTNDTKQVSAKLKKMWGKRNKDGGWGWIVGKKSDSLATSQVLYAVVQARKAYPDLVEQDEMDSIAQYLVNRQGKKGTWANRGTKTSMKGRIEPTATYWATCWAVISLSSYHYHNK